MTSQRIQVKVKSHPVVVMEAEVARKIRQHARTSMKAEVCGVLIGSMDEGRTAVEACIAGINAAQGGAHVTFTQDTWEHIYKIKDQQFPNDKIVGWYHSHPGFGVFLSEHDLFIHENFFSSPQQIAWVYDPHTDEEGCFGWVGGKTEKLSGIRTGYSQNVEVSASTASEHGDDAADADVAPQGSVGQEDSPRDPAWMIWTSRVLGYLAALLVGFALGFLFLQWHDAPYVRALEQKLQYVEAVLGDPGVAACIDRYLQTAPAPGRILENPGAANQQQAPQHSQPVQPPANSGKGSNGKH